MRFKNLLGLLAIGGAVAYAQKKRGGDMSFAGIKNSLKGVVDNVKNQLGQVMGQQGAAANTARRDVGTSNLGSVGGQDDISGTTGYSQSSGYGSDLGTSSSYGSTTGNGIGRKY